MEQVKEFISKAYKHLRHLKQDDTRRDTWIAQLLDAQSQAWSQPKKTLWKQLHTTKRIQKTATKVRQALQTQRNHTPFLQVVAPGPEAGTHQEYHSKVEDLPG